MLSKGTNPCDKNCRGTFRVDRNCRRTIGVDQFGEVDLPIEDYLLAILKLCRLPVRVGFLKHRAKRKVP